MNKHSRILSIDTLRGFDMLFIMGFSTLVASICNLFPDSDMASLISLNMEHVEWNGLRHHDTIFPLFLFIAGISFPFSYSKQLDNGSSKGKIYLKIFKRALILIALGVIYNGFFKLDFQNLRIASVLGRIGTAWMVAALLFINFRKKTRAVIAAATLIGYYLLIRFVGAPDVPNADPLSFEGNLVGYVDRLLLPGKIYSGHFDPEGILSTVPAVVTAMLGMFTGEFISQNRFSGNKKALYMAAAALVMLGAGLLWSLDFPLNKKLWSSSFVLVVGAYSLGLFALFYYLIDVKGWTRWTFPFRVIGMNSITIYMAQKFIDFKYAAKFFFGGLAECCSEEIGAIVLQFGFVAVCWIFLYFLYKKKIFLKV